MLLQLPRNAFHTKVARSVVRQALQVWEQPSLAENGAQLVSELFAHAVLNGVSDEVEVAIESRPSTVRVAVYDPAWHVPGFASLAYGTAILTELSQQWSRLSTAEGTVVWFELPVDE